MSVARFQDLVCWQRANELKVGVYALIQRTTAKRDLSFCNQLRDSAASAPSNIAEGFGVYEHGNAARFARIAKGSIAETLNHLHDGVDRQHWTQTDIEPLLTVGKQAIGATAGWIRFLQHSKAP